MGEISGERTVDNGGETSQSELRKEMRRGEQVLSRPRGGGSSGQREGSSDRAGSSASSR